MVCDFSHVSFFLHHSAQNCDSIAAALGGILSRRICAWLLAHLPGLPHRDAQKVLRLHNVCDATLYRTHLQRLDVLLTLSSVDQYAMLPILLSEKWRWLLVRPP